METICVRLLCCLALLWPRVQASSCPNEPPSSPTRTFASLDQFQKSNVSFRAQDPASRVNFSFAAIACLPRLHPPMGAYLYALDFSNKSLKTITDAAFAELTCLRHLDLSQNRLSALGNRTFEGLGRLLALNLSRNKLAALLAEGFQALTDLNFLDLAFNLIVVVDHAAFERSPALRTLNVSHNLIKTLPQCFDGLTELRELYLDHNSIGMFEITEFSRNAALTRIDLMQNEMVVADFYVSATPSWRNLRFLNFSDNRLALLNMIEIRHLFANTSTCLDLNHNHIECDKLQSLRDGHVCVWPGRNCFAPLPNPENTHDTSPEAFSSKYIAIALSLIGAAFCLLLVYERCNRADLHWLVCPGDRRAPALVDHIGYEHMETVF